MKTCLLVALFSTFALPAYSQQDHQVVHEIIELKYQALKQAMQDGNAELIAREMYTEDGILYRSSGEVAQGRQAIQSAFTGMIEGGVVIECMPSEVEVFGSTAYEIGIASIQDKEGKKRGKRRYLVIWKEHNGEWKMHRDFVQGTPSN